jgi:hypothetical protein
MSRMVLIARLLAMEYAGRDEKMPHTFYFTMKDIGADVKVTIELNDEMVSVPFPWVMVEACR